MRLFSNPKFGILVAMTHIIACTAYSVYIVQSLNAQMDSSSDTLKDKLLSKAVAVAITLLCALLLKIILCCVLIAGICKKNHHLMAPWIAVTFLSAVGVFFYLLVSISSSFVNKQTREKNMKTILPGLIIFIIQVGIFYPIYALYKTILVIRLKIDGLYVSSNQPSHDSVDDLVDSNEVY